MSLEHIDIIKSHAEMIHGLHPNVLDQLTQTNSSNAYGRWCGLWTAYKIAEGTGADKLCLTHLSAHLIYLADKIVKGLPTE